MSSTILTVIVLVVMWLVVLVPMFVRRADEPVDAAGAGASDLTGPEADPEAEAEADDGARATGDADGAAPVAVPGGGRVVARGPFGEVDDGPGQDDTGCYDGPWESYEAEEMVHPGGVHHPTARARMMARRRRTLAALVLLTLATLAAVLLSRGSPVTWVCQVVADLLLAGYLAGLRGEARRMRAHRPAGTAAPRARGARRVPAAPPAHGSEEAPSRPTRRSPRSTPGAATPPRRARRRVPVAEPDEEEYEQRWVV